MSWGPSQSQWGRSRPPPQAIQGGAAVSDGMIGPRGGRGWWWQRAGCSLAGTRELSRSHSIEGPRQTGVVWIPDGNLLATRCRKQVSNLPPVIRRALGRARTRTQASWVVGRILSRACSSQARLGPGRPSPLHASSAESGGRGPRPRVPRPSSLRQPPAAPPRACARRPGSASGPGAPHLPAAWERPRCESKSRPEGQSALRSWLQARKVLADRRSMPPPHPGREGQKRSAKARRHRLGTLAADPVLGPQRRHVAFAAAAAGRAAADSPLQRAPVAVRRQLPEPLLRGRQAAPRAAGDRQGGQEKSSQARSVRRNFRLQGCTWAASQV